MEFRIKCRANLVLIGKATETESDARKLFHSIERMNDENFMENSARKVYAAFQFD